MGENMMLLVALVLHERLQATLLLFMIAMGAWGVFNFVRKQPVLPNYQGALVIGEILILVEALLGLVLYLMGYRLGRMDIHILYGMTTVIAIPGTFAYTRGRDGPKEGLAYACVCLFLAGLAIRMQQIAG